MSTFDQGDHAGKSPNPHVQNDSWVQAAQAVSAGDNSLAAGLASKPLHHTDLLGHSPDDIRLARNTIFAKHGRQFADPTLQSYFDHQPWYQPNPAYSDNDLTPMEQRNVDFLHVFELDHDLNDARSKFESSVSPPADTTGLIEPDAAKRPLIDWDLHGMSMADLRLARNEILARHGLAFSPPDLKERFGQMPWYSPNQEAVPEEQFSWIEERNIEFIKIHELDGQLQKP